MFFMSRFKMHILMQAVFTTLHWMQGGLVARKVSVCLSNSWIATKWKKNLSRFLYRMKDHLA